MEAMRHAMPWPGRAPAPICPVESEGRGGRSDFPPSPGTSTTDTNLAAALTELIQPPLVQ
eukprot:5753148-Pyramimonas_sp.AAC.1